jgi:phosphate transport system substrate-binding protein
MRPFRYFLLPLILAALAATAACATATVPPPPTPALLRVAVTDLTEPLLLDLAAAYAEANPRVSLAPSLAREADLAARLQSGRSDLALTTSPDPQLFATPLGYVPIRLVAHPSNPLETLSLAQAQGLFSGGITNWAQVGGREGQVQAVTRPTDGDAAQALAQTPIGPLTVTVNARVAPTWDAMREIVAQNPNALGYLIAPRLDTGLKPLTVTGPDGAPLNLRLLIAAQASQSPTGSARDFLAWVQSPEGQAAVARRHDPYQP